MLDFLDYKFDVLTLIIVICAGIFLLYRLLYWIIIYGRLSAHFKKERKHKKTVDLEKTEPIGVSVVMVTNNNAEALKDGLLHILEQDYPLFEVVVVNENSNDDTEFVLYVLKQNYPNLTVVNLGKNDNKFESYKFSLSIGIRSAKYEKILLTDVSCTPKGYDWISTMMNPVNIYPNTKIVTGMVLRKVKKGFTGRLIRFDEVMSYMNLFAFTLAGKAYTSTGRNMIYDRQWLIKKGGFINQYGINCNQEDYFVQKHAKKKNTKIVYDRKARMYLPEYSDFSTFVRVKFAESLSKKQLKKMYKILLASNPLSGFLYYGLIIVGCIFGFPWQYAAVATLLMWIVQILMVKSSAKNLHVRKVWLVAPLFEMFFFFFNFMIRVRVLFFRKKEKKIRWDNKK
ncbi:MAG: glycosyltransferase [Bacteroidales bacterium]|nr:glycosyltransferase [Bacteroidales bacterium]